MIRLKILDWMEKITYEFACKLIGICLVLYQYQKIMLNFSERSRLNQAGPSNNIISPRQNYENTAQGINKRNPKQLFLLVPQVGGHLGCPPTSPRNSRNTHTPLSPLTRSTHNSFRLTPTKPNPPIQSSFTRKSRQLFLEISKQPLQKQIQAKQHSFRATHNPDLSGQGKSRMFQDISNTRLKSKSFLRGSVTSNNGCFKNILPPKANKAPVGSRISASKDKPAEVSRLKQKINPYKFVPKHTRTRTATDDDPMDHLNFNFKQLQSQTNTPKTNTPRTNTTSTEKSNINIQLQTNHLDDNQNHTPRTVSNFQKFLANKLHSTLSPKSQFRVPRLCDFEIGPCKGEGRFGKVYPAWHKRTGFLVAIKKIKKEAVRGILKQFIGQLKIGMFVSHTNVVKTYGIFDDSTSIYVLMEYMEEGSLYRFVRNGCMDEDDATSKLLEVCQAVNYLHSLSIIHRDIKPENIVVSNGVCKLCDFGWAVCSKQRRKTYCGTLDYVCPEILQGRSYDNEVDIWAIGVLAFEMLTGRAPFYHVSHEETMESIMNCDFVFPEGMSSAAKGFIAKALKKNPDRRTTIEELLKDHFLYQNEEEQ